MLNEDVLNALPEAIYQRLYKINTEYLQLIGKKVKEVGKMSFEDLRKLQRIQTYGGDIERELENTVNKSTTEIYEMIDAVAKDMYTDMKPAYNTKGIEYIPYAKNKELQRYVESISRQTVKEFVNLTQHTAFCVWAKDGQSANTFFPENRNKIPTSLSETYTRVIDEAVTAAQMGLTDYNSAMRKTLRAISDSGIRTVDYATGYSRRLDTAVRQNVLWGVKQCCVGTAEQLGEELNTDGWEISYHSCPRPSHEEMGGKQYAAGDKGVTVDGKYYPPFSEVADLLQDYNCLHYKMPIILGVSEPIYDDDELAEMKEHDRRTFEYEGKKYTGYEASQIQRKLETEIRRQKDRANIFAASGDDDGRRAAQEKINLLTKKYKDFSDVAGLPYKTERMSVAGFHRVKSTSEVENALKTHKIKGSSGIEYVVEKSKTAISSKSLKALENEFVTYQKRFGSVDCVTQVLLTEYKNDGYWGEYDDNTGILSLAGTNGQSGLSALAKIAKKMHKDGQWSTNSIYHSFRHELTHAWLLQKKQNRDFLPSLYKVYDYRQSLLNGLTSLSESDKILKRQELLSLYGLDPLGEPDDFICECFAEHFNDNPRETAKEVIKILLGG